MPKKREKEAQHTRAGLVGDLLRVPSGAIDLSAIDPRSTPGLFGGKSESQAQVQDLQAQLSDLQERLFAHGRTGGNRRILLVLQGMDTSGKGGVLRHVVGLVDPQGVHIKAFKAPTPEERKHNFLWRIRHELPRPGKIGAFDRSHYEDVIITRVRKLFPASAIARRYDAINRFEAELVESGCEVLKVMLHISFEEQRERLLARLADPTKHWKYNPGDVDERRLWADYQRAYEIAIERCNTEQAPWHVVPSDRKWYRNWAVTRLLAEGLGKMNLEWPPADFNLRQEIERVNES
jgi:PPK2 family polyphosphate:nucleotide phosphotransferase